jgi:hypothetical protein
MGILMPICTIIAVFAFSVFLVSCIGYASDSEDELNVKVLKRSGIVLAISLMGVIAFPSKKDMLLIYGVGTALDYIQENETAKQLPDKCIEALNVWVESLNENKKK